MSGLQTQMRHRDKEMVPKFLIQSMFALMFAAVALVSYAQLTGLPNVGVLVEAPIVAERSIIMTGDRAGTYAVNDAVTGDLIAMSSDDMAGFIGVMGRVIDRQREIEDVVGEQPVRIVRRDNGHIAIIDDTTGMVVELIGYGADNVVAFARLVE